MSDDLPRLPHLEDEWIIWYDRDDEYDKNPPWTDDICAAGSSNDDYMEDGTTTFYDPSRPEEVWITSSYTYDLTNTL